MSNTNEKIIKKTQNELLNDTLDFMTTELEAIKDSFQAKVKDSTANGRCYQAKLGCSVSLPGSALKNPEIADFSLFLVVCLVVQLIYRLKTEKLNIFTFTCKHMDKSEHPHQ